MGDNDVPNALHWIDKYTQIPRILSPIVEVVGSIEQLAAEAPGVKAYVQDVFGSVDSCTKIILGDFFRHGFDGSGADNFYDAGSCIDGRLTSAWNWCSKLEKKKYHAVFKMAGFSGFDGAFTK
uniref:Non-canonical E2 ubiquitin-conjugating enzyme C-terminal domain-containing protein n=1 Tax=Coccolithus braarudii TaxID=221442 RepID=A0A7S0L121_9EUKA